MTIVGRASDVLFDYKRSTHTLSVVCTVRDVRLNTVRILKQVRFRNTGNGPNQKYYWTSCDGSAEQEPSGCVRQSVCAEVSLAEVCWSNSVNFGCQDCDVRKLRYYGFSTYTHTHGECSLCGT